MAETDLPKPFAYIASRRGEWIGSCAAEAFTADGIRKFYSDMAGADITVVYSREEHKTLCDKLQ